MFNLVKTAMLLAVMTVLFMIVGYLLAGETGMIIALIAAAAMNLFSWWNSGKMVLRMHNAREVDEETAPGLVNIVRDLAENAGLPMPRVYVLETSQPNAFATGRNPENAAVAASTGLLDELSEEEVAAVMAHELAHIKSRDTLTMTITATLAGAISMISNFAYFFRGGRNNGMGIIGMLIAMFVAPMAAGIVQMAISRAREYEADRDGAEICGNPLWLASALRKIAGLSGRSMNEQAEASPATAHMFIINPLNGRAFDGLFSTHPATENRIAALEALNEQWQSTHQQQKPRPQLPKRQKEIWGRDAGKWRDEFPNARQSNQDRMSNNQNASPTDDDSDGPWHNPSSHKRGPWS